MKTEKAFVTKEELDKIERDLVGMNHVTQPHTLNENECKAGQAFLDKHKNCRSMIELCAGYSVGYSLTFTGTNIGEVVTITCDMCGQEENITDYNVW